VLEVAVEVLQVLVGLVAQEEAVVLQMVLLVQGLQVQFKVLMVVQHLLQLLISLVLVAVVLVVLEVMVQVELVLHHQLQAHQYQELVVEQEAQIRLHLQQVQVVALTQVMLPTIQVVEVVVQVMNQLLQ
jgi:uncharacterized membrane protein